jgi:hypothetical protein
VKYRAIERNGGVSASPARSGACGLGQRATRPTSLARAAEMLAADSRRARQSDYALGEAFGMHWRTVAAARRRLEEQSLIAKETVRIGKDGVLRNVSRIGRWPRNRATWPCTGPAEVPALSR